MSHFKQTDIIINAPKPVDYNEKAIQRELDANGLIAQTKLDGVRFHLVITPTADIDGRPAARGQFISRSHKVIPALSSMFSTEQEQIELAEFLAESRFPDGIVIDGEVMVKGLTFDASSGALRRKKQLTKSEILCFNYGVYELAPLLADKNARYSMKNAFMEILTEVTTDQLRDKLPGIDWLLPESVMVYTMEDLNNIYEKVRAAGHEGLVLKTPMLDIHRGKKTGWWKMKPDDSVDGNVVGILWGTPGLSNEGKVIGFEVLLENGNVVNVDGLTEAQKEEFTGNVLTHTGCADANEYQENYVSASYYEGWSIQVNFMQWTEEGSLRHPKFGCFRGMPGSETEKS